MKDLIKRYLREHLKMSELNILAYFTFGMAIFQEKLFFKYQHNLFYLSSNKIDIDTIFEIVLTFYIFRNKIKGGTIKP